MEKPERSRKSFFEYPTYYEEDLKWMGSKAFAFYFPSMEPYLLSEASEDDSDIINALANTLQIRLKQDPQSIKGCLVPALRILDYISENMQNSMWILLYTVILLLN